MTDKCDKIRNKLSAYLDGQLPPEEMAEVAAHLETCPECSALLEKMRRVDEMAETAVPDFDDDLMNDLTGRIMEGIEEPESAAQKTASRPRVIPVWYRYVAIAASIIIVFLAGRMAFKESGGSLLNLPERNEIMTPVAEDTMTLYRESLNADDEAKKARLQSLPSPEIQTQSAREKSAPAPAEENIAEGYGKQTITAEKEDLPAPATIETPPTEESSAEQKPQPAFDMARKPSQEEPAGKSESSGKIAGRIVDAKTGEPLFGVMVQLQGTTIGAKSDIDGDFTILSVPPDTYDLMYSSPGYESLVYTEVPVYPGETEELTVALKQAALESGVFAEVRGTRKGIDFREPDTGQKKPTETVGEVTVAAKAFADESAAARVALPDADSLDAQYVSLLNDYRGHKAAEGKKGIVSQKLSAYSQQSVAFLGKIIDSLNTSVAEAKNPAERIDASYLRLRAALDLYRASGKAEDKNRLDSYEADFDRELSELAKQGYDQKTLDAYRNSIEQIKLRK